MGLSDKIKSYFAKKDESSPLFRREFAKKINNRHIRYVTERKNGIEEIVGKEGHLNILPGETEIAVTCGIEEIFRSKIDETAFGELMSLEGVVLEGYDLTCKRARKITAFYKYYR